jgi:RND family efflux transporter MFP subunit
MSAEKNATSGNKAVWIKIGVGVFALAILIAWSSGFFKSKVAASQLEVVTGVPVPEGRPTIQVKTEMIAPRVDLVGTVASGEKILLSSRISAYVKRVYASAGDTVKENQLLIRLDNRDLKEQLAAAEARLTQAQSEYQRSLKLKEADATTDQALTAAKSAFDSARAQVQQIKVMLTYTEITSPIDGKVTDRQVEAGDLASPGQVLLAVFAPYNLRIEVPVPVRLVEKLQLGQEVRVELDRPNRPLTGKVTEVVGEVDPMSRTQKMKVHLQGSLTEILPGTFGRVWISDDPRPTILVPATAVYRIGQLEMVQVVRDYRAIRRLVKTGQRYDNRIEILSGLSENDTILVEPIKG